MLGFINSNRIAAVGLAAALILVIVTMFGRFGDHSQSNTDVEKTSATTPPNSPTQTPTPDDGNEPVSQESGTPGVEGLDSDRFAVPVDPTRSRQDRTEIGAQQSALDFAGTVHQRLLYLTEDSATELLTSWSSNSADFSNLESEIDEIATLRSTLASGGGGVWWSVTPIASHVDAFDSDRARVSVWVVQVIGSDVDPRLGGDAVAPTVDFRTTVVDLVWDGAPGWSVWDTSSRPGPVPMLSATSTMSAPTEFMDALGDFTLTRKHS